MKPVMNVLIFLLQSVGVILVGEGLAMIWTPLALIYAGTVAFILGNLLYQVMKSEEIKK